MSFAAASYEVEGELALVEEAVSNGESFSPSAALHDRWVLLALIPTQRKATRVVGWRKEGGKLGTVDESLN